MAKKRHSHDPCFSLIDPLISFQIAYGNTSQTPLSFIKVYILLRFAELAAKLQLMEAIFHMPFMRNEFASSFADHIFSIKLSLIFTTRNARFTFFNCNSSHLSVCQVHFNSQLQNTRAQKLSVTADKSTQ